MIIVVVVSDVVIVASFKLSSLPLCYVVVDAPSSIVVQNAVEVVISVVISSHYCSVCRRFTVASILHVTFVCISYSVLYLTLINLSLVFCCH